MSERLLIVWAGGVRPGAGPGGRWPRFSGGWPDGLVTCGAVFAKLEGVWQCVRAGRWLEWFVGLPISNIEYFLREAGRARPRNPRYIPWRYAWAKRCEVA